jgi:DNA-binding XRE family transcriptional regulator
MNYLNQRSKEIRKELGYNQDEYSQLLGVKRCTLGAYEENRAQIPLYLIPKIMELGNVSKKDMYDFIFNEDFKIEEA